MITSITFYISQEFEEENLRALVGKFCDILDEEDLANLPDNGILSVGVVKTYDVDEVEEPQFLEDIFEDSLFAVLPISTHTTQEKGEKNVS